MIPRFPDVLPFLRKPFGQAARLMSLAQQRASVPLAMVVAGALVQIAAPRLAQGPLHSVVLGLGLVLLVYGAGRFLFVMRAAAQGGSAVPAAVMDLLLQDPSATIITRQNGMISAFNASAVPLFSHGALAKQTHIASCLAAFAASPAPVVAKLIARALAHGSAVDDIQSHIQSHGQSLRITVLRVQSSDAFVWRFDAGGGGKTKTMGAEGISLPMLTANKAGVVLFCNTALRNLLGRRPKSLADIASPEQWRTSEEMLVKAATGEVSVLLVELPSQGQRREIYLLPLPKSADETDAGSADYEDIPVALMTFAPDGQLRFANAAAREIIAPMSQDASYFHDMFDALGRPASDWLADVIEGRLPMGSQVVRLSKSPSDGPSFVQVTLRRMVQQARPSVLAVIQDANALKTLEEQFVQSQKMQAIGQLAGGVAHDFNNLLTAISGNTDLLLLRHAGDDPSYPDLMQIRQNANRAAALVAQLLAFSRKQTLQPEYLDMQDVFSELTHLLNRLVGEKLRLLLTHGDGIGTIRADRRQLEQVIVNLVLNARDAMAQGGTISLTTHAVHLAQHLQRDRAIVPAGDYAKISISDTGTGMPSEILHKIFEPFFTTKKAGEGTGLGLSTAYGIVKQSGGFIFVDSKLDEGTTFTLYFPIHNRPVGEAAAPPKPVSIRQGEGVVLLVEDEAPVRAFAARALRLRGYTVLEAATGEEALDSLRDSGVQVDLFISDVIMPGMDGPTWVREAQLVRPDIPVIFVSGYAEDVMSEHQARIANSTFLPKPFSLADLTLAVQEKLLNGAAT
ncbi:MAG: ATP-binding protein [Cypionkella sp.]|nr:ATP-binding protein [Cypionkella sp.]